LAVVEIGGLLEEEGKGDVVFVGQGIPVHLAILGGLGEDLPERPIFRRIPEYLQHQYAYLDS